MSATTFLQSFGGGLLIGAGVAVLLLVNGRVAGISGITANILRGLPAPGTEVAFLAGLLLPAAFVGLGESTVAGGLPLLAASGLLVGSARRWAVVAPAATGSAVSRICRGARWPRRRYSWRRRC